MKKIILFVLSIFLFGQVKAQQENVFAQYHLNPFLVNPAAAGSKNFHTVFSHLRFQWTGLPNSPKTGLVSYQAPLNNIGLGLTVFSDRVASLNRFGANFAYSYRVKINNKKLAIGMSGHYQRFYLDQSANEGIENQDDVVVYDAMDGLNVYDANLGVFFYSEKMYMGFSIPNLVQARLNTIGTNLSTISQLSRQYIFTAGYKYLPPKSLFSVEPSILLRKVETLPFQALLTMKLGMMNDKIFTAFTYGTTDVVTFTVGYQIMPEGKIAYSYDYSLGEIYRYTRGSHEVSFIWEFGKPAFQMPSKKKKLYKK